MAHHGSVTPSTPLPERANQTSAEHPWPVRLLSTKIADYINKMTPVWIEGQIVQLNRRPGAAMAFLTLRDTDTDVSLPVAMYAKTLANQGDGAAATLTEGAHVVVNAKPVFWKGRGSFQMQASEIRAVGVGELLARIEQLKTVLAAEGLFAAERKRPLPFLPAVVGLICGRESKAEHDVVVNARARWPQVRFEIREVAVQGVAAVPEVSAAIAELDANPEVEVIVVARGGGAVEDLLPFSNEALVRAAAACSTPLVSAIGHETDSPLLDLVADYRASTPTDAAKRIVPDVSEERRDLRQARVRMNSAITGMLQREQTALDAFRTRPVLANPHSLIDAHARELAQTVRQTRSIFDSLLLQAAGQVSTLHAQVTALSPASTLARGYAVVQGPDGAVLRGSDDVDSGAALRIRLARGEIGATAN